MRKFFRLFLCIGFVASFLVTNHARAQDEPVWITKNKAILKKAFKEKNCDMIWGTIWPDVKAGDPVAINVLMMFVVSFMHMDQIYLPHVATRNDWAFRDGIQLTIYALKIKNLGYETFQNKEWADERLSSALKNNPRAPDFLKCLKEKGNGECTDIAVRDKVIPSFTEFTKEIDDAIKQGKKPSCEFDTHNEDAVKTEMKEKR